MIDKNANGCIMADGMGLGKTVGFDVLQYLMRLTSVASMYLFDVDTFEAVSRGRKDYDSEVYHCLPVKSGGKLGQ